MTMAEIDADEKRLYETFAGLRAMRDRLEKELHITLPELSMGMSSDFPEAIAEGRDDRPYRHRHFRQALTVR